MSLCLLECRRVGKGGSGRAKTQEQKITEGHASVASAWMQAQVRQNSGQQLSGADGKNTNSRVPTGPALWGCGNLPFYFQNMLIIIFLPHHVA